MKTKYIAMTILALLVYCITSYYIGLKLANSLLLSANSVITGIWWVCFTFITAAYFLGRAGSMFYASVLTDWLIRTGSYWLAFYFYFLLIWGIVDGIIWAGREIGLIPIAYSSNQPVIGWSTVIIVSLVVVYGIWRANSPQLKKYDITINKQSPVHSIHIIMVSDLHLGLLVGRQRLENLVNQIHQLKPDLILLPGDILDENIGIFLDDNMPEVLRRLQPQFGVFGCLGSHEYIWGDSEKTVCELSKAGITILRDEAVKIADAFYLAGRDDYYREKLTDSPRKTVQEILQGCVQALPVIMMDHQPVEVAAGQQQGVDLYVAGHTHHGQLFPLNLITQAMFKLDWGYWRQDDFQMIVSSGFGTWGPPVRVGTQSEIVSITVHFKNR
jgi:predicted MPP superfamily phosphohydrolase